MTSQFRRPILFVLLAVLLVANVSYAQTEPTNIQQGGFASLTGFGNSLSFLPGIGLVPSPIFARLVTIGNARTGVLSFPRPAHWTANESIQPSSSGGITIDGTLTSLCYSDDTANCLSGKYACSTTQTTGSGTYEMSCTLTITGGKGNCQNAVGTGSMGGIVQLFPSGSIFAVYVATWNATFLTQISGC